MGYDEALEMQRALVTARTSGQIPDTLLLLEHPHVLTLGVHQGGRANILAAPDTLVRLGVAVHEAGRGGDVTYHGPGQLVGYPIIDLRPDRQDVHQYVRDVEDVMIRACADYGINARRLAGFSGAWVDHAARGPEKIAAIGVRIARWVTSHGFAFNVNTDLEFFRLIVPCGIADRGVTSLQALTGNPVALDRVATSIATHFAAVFDRSPVEDASGVAS